MEMEGSEIYPPRSAIHKPLRRVFAQALWARVPRTQGKVWFLLPVLLYVLQAGCYTRHFSSRVTDKIKTMWSYNFNYLAIEATL